jgi:hypothetical protein
MWKRWWGKIHWGVGTVIVPCRLSTNAVKTLFEVTGDVHHFLCGLRHSIRKSRLFLARFGPDGEQLLADRGCPVQVLLNLVQRYVSRLLSVGEKGDAVHLCKMHMEFAERWIHFFEMVCWGG